MKQIAVIPNLGDSTSINAATTPTSTMAGNQTKDIFFALSYKDFSDWGTSNWCPKYSQNTSTRLWTRTAHAAAGFVNIAFPSGAAITNTVAATEQSVVPGVWVKVS